MIASQPKKLNLHQIERSELVNGGRKSEMARTRREEMGFLHDKHFVIFWKRAKSLRDVKSFKDDEDDSSKRLILSSEFSLFPSKYFLSTFCCLVSCKTKLFLLNKYFCLVQFFLVHFVYIRLKQFSYFHETANLSQIQK